MDFNKLKNHKFAKAAGGFIFAKPDASKEGALPAALPTQPQPDGQYLPPPPTPLDPHAPAPMHYTGPSQQQFPQSPPPQDAHEQAQYNQQHDTGKAAVPTQQPGQPTPPVSEHMTSPPAQHQPEGYFPPPPQQQHQQPYYPPGPVPYGQYPNQAYAQPPPGGHPGQVYGQPPYGQHPAAYGQHPAAYGQPAYPPQPAVVPESKPPKNKEDQDYLDIAFGTLAKKSGFGKHLDRQAQEKVTDGLRGGFEKLTGKKLNPKFSN